MKVCVKPGQNELDVASWNADKPDVVVSFLRKQLEAAKATWPEELEKFFIIEAGHVPERSDR